MITLNVNGQSHAVDADPVHVQAGCVQRQRAGTIAGVGHDHGGDQERDPQERQHDVMRYRQDPFH
jgi:hypothetical protein